MRNININFQKNTIEISSAFAKKASNYGSDEYIELTSVKHDFPNFRIVTVKAPSNKAPHFKGLTIDYMKKYITKKDGAESERMKTFNILRGNTNDELAVKATYGEIKMWFLSQYPELENAQADIEGIISQAKETHEQQKKERDAHKAA